MEVRTSESGNLLQSHLHCLASSCLFLSSSMLHTLGNTPSDGSGGKCCDCCKSAEGIVLPNMRRRGLGGLTLGRPKTDLGGNLGYWAHFIDCEGNLQGIQAPN